MKKTWKDPETPVLEKQEVRAWPTAAVVELWLKSIYEVLAFVLPGSGYAWCRTLAGATGKEEAIQGWGNPTSL